MPPLAVSGSLFDQGMVGTGGQPTEALAAYAEQMMKAAGGGLRPRWVPDRRYDQIRRYSRTHSGILDDQTPHLEPSLLP